MSKAVESVTSALFGRPEQPDIPEATVPAAPAPSRREDTGANIVVGADKSSRVSGRGGGGSRAKVTDVIGGLGKGGGLSI